MITIITLCLLFLSIFAFFVDKHILSVFLLLLASSRSIDGHVIICCIGFILTLHCMRMDFSKIGKTVWLISALFICYQLIVLAVYPYKIYYSYPISYLNAYLMFLATISIKWDREKITQFTLAYMAILIFWGLLEFMVVSPLRIAGPFHFATLYAVVLVSIWTIWLSDSIINNDYPKIIMVTSLVLLAVLLSGTRMGLLGMVLGLCLGGFSKILIANFKRAFFTKIFFGIALLACVLLLVLIVWLLIPDDLLIKRNFKTILSMKLDSSNLGRVFSWVAAIDIIPKHTFWGIGSGNFNTYVQKFLQENGIQLKGSLPHAHNLFLIVLSEHGLIGFTVIGLIVFMCTFKLFYRIINRSQNSMTYAILNGFIVMMFMGMFDATPLTLGTLCFGGWLMGISFKISNMDIARL